VRAGADAEVVAELPVVEVVQTAMAGSRIRGDFVAVESDIRRPLHDVIEHLGRQVVMRQHGRVLREQGIRLDRQMVGREVWWLVGQRSVEVGRPLGQRLSRQRVHQVDVERVESSGRFRDGGMRLCRVVNAADRAQLRVIEALHTDRQPGHAGRAKGAEAIALEGPRIRFERDLAAGFERQPRANVGQQSIDRFGCEEARRAAADEDAVDAPAPDERQRGFEIGAQRVQVPRLGQRVHIGFG
jgi:hypothetical protein